jgi:O-acetyl-ADP-ribose deacetylase (regulator of RNase III)
MSPHEAVRVEIGTRLIEIVVGNIVTEDTDAIVNAAQKSLFPGGGVDGEIHLWGGPQIWQECRELGGCETGDAKITTGGSLKAKYVIHTVGPIWTGGGSGEAELLASCYRSCLQVAAAHNIATIAFPAISTGNYSYPVEAASQIALRTVIREMKVSGSLKLVRFVLKGRKAFDAYCAALHAAMQSEVI